MTKTQAGSIGERLEISLVTYNRALFLDNTLRQLAASPFRNVGITIFDNCSTDATQNICRKYADMFPSFAIVRHKSNIGRYANCLHAVENLRAEYGWILCDDDNLDFSSVSQLVQEIESGIYEVLHVGSRTKLIWDGAESCSMAQLVTAKARVYPAFSYWPALIFRTSLFDEECIVKGYRMINSLHPNFPFINSLVERNASIYVSPQPIVIRTETNTPSLAGLSRYAAWVNCCQTIKNRDIREQTIDDITAGYGNLKTLASWIAFDKESASNRFWSRIVDIAWGLPLRQRLKLLLLFPLMIIPVPRSWLKKCCKKICMNGKIWGHKI